MIKYPIVFFADQLTDESYIDSSSIDTLSFQELRIASFNPNEIAIETSDNSTGKYLVYVQNHHPSWNVYIDAKEAEVVLVSETFMAVEIPKGKHTIEYKFEPTTIVQASYVSLSTLVLIILFLFIPFLKSLKKAEQKKQ